MKIHLIVAHHDKNSFNFALHNKAIEVLTSSGVKFFESDRYGKGFNPAASYHDAINLAEENKQNLAKAQRWVLENNAFTSEVAEEQNKVASAEIIILQFPLWWWSFPAILKGWIDRVPSSGFTYGKNAQLRPKKVMYSITTGGANHDSELNYYNKKLMGFIKMYLALWDGK